MAVDPGLGLRGCGGKDLSHAGAARHLALSFSYYDASMDYRFARAQVFTLVVCAVAAGLNVPIAVLLLAKGRGLSGAGCVMTIVAMALVVMSMLKSGRVASGPSAT